MIERLAQLGGVSSDLLLRCSMKKLNGKQYRIRDHCLVCMGENYIITSRTKVNKNSTSILFAEPATSWRRQDDGITCS